MQDFIKFYRPNFKAFVTDAQIMGTLHSAATVIKINLKKLLLKKKQGQLSLSLRNSSNFRSKKRRAPAHKSIPGNIDQSDNSSIYIDTED